ncbi:MAG: hypothetical protein KAG61_06555, partial [Bacteriovoracaceae bacterium]|nr:hypothetical protein [Bacteriovoracaceae bacterium]
KDTAGKTNAEINRASNKIVALEKKLVKEAISPATKNIKFLKFADTLIDRVFDAQLALLEHGNNSITSPDNLYKVDSYRIVYDAVKVEVMDTVRQYNGFQDRAILKISDETIAKVSKDMDQWLEKSLNIKNKAINYTDAATSFNNVVKVAVMTFASSVGGPIAGAAANVLVDKFILEKEMTIEEMAKSMAIGMAAAGAGQMVGGAIESASIAHMSSQIASNMTRTLADSAINHNKLSEKELLTVLITSAANVKFENNITTGMLNGASANAIAQIIDKKKLNIDNGLVVDSAIEGGVYAGVDGAIEENVKEATKEVAESARQLMKEMLRSAQIMLGLIDSLESISLLNPDQLLEHITEEEMETLKKTVELESKNAKDMAAQEVYGKLFDELTAEEQLNSEFAHELYSQLQAVQLRVEQDPAIVAIITELNSNPDSQEILANLNVNGIESSDGRHPSALFITSLIASAIAVDVYFSFTEIKEIVNMDAGKERDERIQNFIMMEAAGFAIGALTAGVGKLAPKMLKLFGPGRKLLQHFAEMGIKTSAAKKALIKSLRKAEVTGTNQINKVLDSARKSGLFSGNKYKTLKDNSSYETVKSFLRTLGKSDVPLPVKKNLVKSFDLKTIKKEIVNSDVYVYRWHNNDEVARKLGRFVSDTPITDKDAARRLLALPADNKMLHLDKFKIKHGTEIYRGKIAPLNGHTGGGSQIFITGENIENILIPILD